MSDAPLDWESCRVFLAVVRLGSVPAAAAVLGLSPVTIRRRLTALEDRLGQPLFSAKGRPPKPTAAGMDLLAVAQMMEASVLAFVAEAATEREGMVGSVRILTTEIIGEQVLIPGLAPLCLANPGLRLELVFMNWGVDVAGEAADIAVLPAGEVMSGMSRVGSGRVVWGLHGHRDYLALRGWPRTRDELPDFDLIGFESLALRDVFKDVLGLELDDPCVKVRIDSVQAQYAAVAAGLGLLLCQVHMAARWPDLVRVLPEAEFLHGYDVLHADSRRGIGRVDKVLAEILASLETYVGESGRPDDRTTDDERLG